MNLPSDFVIRTRRLMGDADFTALSEALEKETPVSIRMNINKCKEQPAGSTPVPWCADGYYLSGRPAFTFDPLFHAGCYYVQEASSMFLEQALCQYVHEPAVMLDLCAAPGGKSTLARAVLPEGSLLVANEVMRNRSQVLAENLIKWGHPEVIVTNNDPADFTELGPLFDVILTDVPCSGEGMFRKDEVAVQEWSIENVDTCWQRQRRILRDIWPCLKTGGLLVYSTCTYNQEENEDNVAWIAQELGAEILSLEVQSDWNISGNLSGADFPVYRFLPHKTMGEGLFMAVLRKTAEEEMECARVKSGSKSARKNKGGKTPVLQMPREMQAWIQEAEKYDFVIEGTEAVAFPSLYKETYDLLKSRLKVLHGGIILGELKGKDWQPSHVLAMSTALKENVFPMAELSYEQAVSYLRKEAVVLSPDVPKGYVVLTYRGQTLGFAKNIGNRANNLYPQEWRIRSGYLPEFIPNLFG